MVTITNANIERNAETMKFYNADTNTEFDFSTLWDEETRTYDGMSVKEYILYSVATHSDKMENIPSISGSPFNKLCNARAENPNYICYECYSRKLLTIRTSLHFKCEKNEWFYTHVHILPHEVPRFKDYARFADTKYFRFESFGELTNTTKIVNYLLIARMNIVIKFGFFTKNTFLVNAVINAYKRMNETIPPNVVFTHSSIKTNCAELDVFEKYPFVENNFTVYDSETIERENIKINCAKTQCYKCGRCYNHAPYANSHKITNEKIK